MTKNSCSLPSGAKGGVFSSKDSRFAENCRTGLGRWIEKRNKVGNGEMMKKTESAIQKSVITILGPI